MFVSGDSRTGKSFLANYLMGQLNGFPLGAAVEVSNDLLIYTMWYILISMAQNLIYLLGTNYGNMDVVGRSPQGSFEICYGH